MSTETMSNAAVAEHNRTVARRWIDASTTAATPPRPRPGPLTTSRTRRTASRTAALDSDAWVEFLGVFLEGFPDLHLEVLDSSADEAMVAQRILFTGTHTGYFRGLPPTNRQVRFSGLEINRMHRREGRRALVPAGCGDALRAARPAHRPGPATASAATGLADHHGCCGRGGARSPHKPSRRPRNSRSEDSRRATGAAEQARGQRGRRRDRPSCRAWLPVR